MSAPGIATWQLRGRVPVDRDYVAARPEAERLGSLDRVTAERHGAIRVGTPAELADVADLFAAFGMYPVGFYDLREADGTVTEGPLRVRFGEVEARGVTLTRKGFECFGAMATADPAVAWGEYFPNTHEEMASQGLAYYHQGDPTAPVVYEDFLPASAAGIFRSNLDSDSEVAAGADESGYSQQWMAGAIGHHIHDPYDLYGATAQEPTA